MKLSGVDAARTYSQYGFVFNIVKDCVFVDNLVYSPITGSATLTLEIWYGFIEDCVFRNNGGRY